MLYLPVEMLPGAYVTYDAMNIARDVAPCDVYVMYTVRIDVLTAHDFVLQTAHHPPEPKPPGDWFSWALAFWDQFFKTLGLWNPFRMFGEWGSLVAFIVLLIVIFLVVVVLLAIFFPGALFTLKAVAPKPRRRRK